MRLRFRLRRLVRGLDGAARPADGEIAGRILAISSLIGFSYGVFVRPTLLQSVDSALVASGVLPLPKSNPAYVWATTSYSLYSIQIPALLLKLGAPSWKLCVLLSGVQAAVATSAVATWTLLLSRNWPLAIFTPFLFMHLQFSGHRYPIFFPLTEYDPGAVGFYATLLTLALLGLRRFYAAALLIGLMPSIHPIWALACWFTAGLALLEGGRRRLRCLRPSLKYFLTGLAVVLASYLVQRIVIQGPDQPPSDPQLVAQYSEGFLQNWDSHRQPAGFEHDPLRLLRFFESDLYFWVLCLAFLRFFPGAAPRGVRFLLGALMGSSLLEAGSVLVEELAPALFPSGLKMLIIARLLNVDGILYPLLVISGLGQLAFRLRSLAGAGLITALLALVHFDVVTRATVFRYSWIGFKSMAPLWDAGGVAFPVSAVALLALLALDRLRQFRLAGEPPRRVAPRPFWPRRLATLAILGFAGHAFVLLVATSYDRWRHSSVENLRGGPSKRAVYEAAAKGQGLLIVAPDEKWPQLKAARPVLLSPFLVDVLTYAPQATPAMEDILKSVYGASLLKAGFPDVRDLWEARPRDGWRKIRERFEATDVLAPSAWRLQLPEVARSRALVLYHIPENGEFASERDRGGS